MRFGAHYLPTYVPDLDGPVTEFYRRMFEQMEELDRLGFDSVWVTEHHFTDYGGSISHPPTFLSAIARTTRRIRLGVAISVLPFHNPIEVAESYAMVDVISNGRLDFGMGRGSEAGEYKRANVRIEEGAARMREAAEIIRQAWSDEPVNFEGEFFQYHDVRVLPKPVQRPHPPIWVGASKTEGTFRWAAEHGYNLMTLPYLYPDLDVLRRCVRLYGDTPARAGLELAQREILGKFHVYVSDSLDRAIREAEPYLQNYTDVHHGIDPSRRLARVGGGRDLATQMAEGFVIAGDPQRCIDAIHRWRDQVGLTTLTGTFYFGGMPQQMAMKNIRLFAERVMPALR
jgi:alkanesulfonate monooxygenase SsuD/methylene tetrahydromethanopterin reductase-like flavin-dependent oxidoreductase (luciferase family)